MPLHNENSNVSKAVRSLATLRPTGLLTVAAINPHLVTAPIIKTFDMKTERRDLRSWIKAREGKLNLHFILNPPRRRMDRKPREQDIGEFQYAFIECDPAGNETAEQSIARHRTAIEQFETRPTAIWNSGNGVVAAWRIDDPVTLNSTSDVLESKSINIALKHAFGGIAVGVDNCQNLDRLLRMPYTLNIPDKRKLAKGRTTVRAGEFYADSTRAVSIFDFFNAALSEIRATTPISIGEANYLDSLADVPTSERVKEIIAGGRVRNEIKEGDDSRSAWRFEAICQLIRDGLALETILGLLTDERYAISERAHETSDPEAYARKEIGRAQRLVDKAIAADFPDDIEATTIDEGTEATRPAIVPSPYIFTRPEGIPRREWVYKPNFIRRFIGLTTATGGAGKSSLILVEMIAMAIGKGLLGIEPAPNLRTWYWNGEDPQEELQRRVQAILKYYEVTAAEIEGRFFLDSGRDLPIKIAETRNGTARIAVPVAIQLVEAIRDLKIDVLAIDPFVSSHAVPENDNGAIEMVAKQWADIADKTNCAIQISHHTRKTGGESASIEDSRGASSLNYAARTRRSINTMNATEAKNAGIEGNARRAYFRADNANSSMTKPADALDWYRFVSIDLGNGDGAEIQGDEVGVVTSWSYEPLSLELDESDSCAAMRALGKGGPWRKDPQSPDWAGNAIADAVGLASGDKDVRKQLAALLARWLNDGLIEEYQGKTAARQPKTFIRLADRFDFG